MATPTMKATKEWKAMEGKSKAGWRAYYAVCEEMWEMSCMLHKSRTENKKLISQIKDGVDVDLDYLKKQFVELNEQANKTCGHLTCKECFEKMTDCPICRKTYWKPKVA